MKKLKEKVKKLKLELLALYYAYQDENLNNLPKLMITLTLAYALSPIDLIPDFIPVLGYLDDLIILPLLIILSIKIIPKDTMDKARDRASKEPIKLKENKITAMIFMLIWLLLVLFIVKNNLD
jgi:uncharacterized membrane protein YkvA (DUF1232 family)